MPWIAHLLVAFVAVAFATGSMPGGGSKQATAGQAAEAEGHTYNLYQSNTRECHSVATCDDISGTKEALHIHDKNQELRLDSTPEVVEIEDLHPDNTCPVGYFGSGTAAAGRTYEAKKLPGKDCGFGSECSSGYCWGGHCCNEGGSSTGCIKCSSLHGGCWACDRGYKLLNDSCQAWGCTTASNGACASCVALASRTSDTDCASCNDGYLLVGSVCHAILCTTTAKGVGCKTCLPQDSRVGGLIDCNSCHDGYYLSSGSCRAFGCTTGPRGACKICVSQELRASDDHCATCNDGYYESSGTCQEITMESTATQETISRSRPSLKTDEATTIASETSTKEEARATTDPSTTSKIISGEITLHIEDDATIDQVDDAVKTVLAAYFDIDSIAITVFVQKPHRLEQRQSLQHLLSLWNVAVSIAVPEEKFQEMEKKVANAQLDLEMKMKQELTFLGVPNLVNFEAKLVTTTVAIAFAPMISMSEL